MAEANRLETAELWEILRTAGARRRFRPTPVGDEQLRALIEAATRAPSGKNRQTWSFIVVREPGQRAKVGALYRAAWYERVPPSLTAPPAGEAEARDRRNWRWLANHMGEAPALIFACLEGPPPDDPFQLAPYYGSIFPAIQNLILAARALGLGTTLTTVHRAREAELRALLGAPAWLDLVALLPLGYPANPFKPLRRRPVNEVLHLDGW